MKNTVMKRFNYLTISEQLIDVQKSIMKKFMKSKHTNKRIQWKSRLKTFKTLRKYNNKIGSRYFRIDFFYFC